MFRWVPYAMVRIAAFFIAGILLGIYNPDFIEFHIAVWILCVLVFLYLVLFLIIGKKQRTSIMGFIGLAAIFMAGFVHLLSFADWNKPNHLSGYTGEIKFYEAEVLSLPEEKENSLKYSIKILSVSNGESWTYTNAKALLYIRKDRSALPFFYGDKILVQGKPQLLAPTQNPHEFDFKRFLSFKNIYHQQFVKAHQVQLIQSIKTKDVRYYSFVARQWAAEKLKAQLPGKKEQAIALALTLGVTDGIDNDLQSAYAASGAMHVLAVSGLHVGIFYAIVLLFFRPLRSLSWSRWVIALISLVVLWSFAFITGLSPSVLRAVTMFSFIAIAKPFGRSTSIYNTLAASAFLLLFIDPYLIMSVGFQLSYLAVLGIVSVHRSLYQLWEPNSVLLDWVWNISCVSIAAQLATFSLGILYFHQFPVYFLFSNLFVIPGAIAVLVTSILVIATSFFTPLSALLGIILQWLIQLLNYAVFTIEKFPFSLINNIYFTTWQCWLLMLAIASFLLLFYTRQFRLMIVSFLFIVAFSASQWHHYFSEVKQDRFIVYNIPGHTGIEWISNGHSDFFADTSLVIDSERIRFHIRPNRLFSGVNSVDLSVLEKQESEARVIIKNGKQIGMINAPITSWPAELKLNYLIIRNNSVKSLAQIKNTVIFDKLILDSSNNSFLAERIRKEDDELVHAVQHEGAYEEIF